MWWGYFKRSATDTLQRGGIVGCAAAWLAMMSIPASPQTAAGFLVITRIWPAALLVDAAIATYLWLKHRGDQ